MIKRLNVTKEPLSVTRKPLNQNLIMQELIMIWDMRI